MAIGENIKSLRLQHGLSQAELANVAGVSDKAVSSWEQNKSVPRMGAIQKMADYFGVQKSAIIEHAGANTDTPTARPLKSRLALNVDETKLISDYRNLNGNNRQAIDVMIALFLSQQSGGGGGDFSANAAAV
ncbi:MAG: helix-turn-helix domain-containing protein [Selenomonadaceae bacterium]|nr:helix-turn-helix domain-containing protein [Selenomonadaceae bacterium]